MINHVQFYYRCLKCSLVIIITVFLSSCEKNKDEKPTNFYLENYELLKTITIPSIQATMTLLTYTYPEAASLQSNINYDVQVYKINYKTHYKSEIISASGLICVPVANESFPLVSFQNGTNTVNTSAPSLNANDPSFLSLESFAGCGYIMIMPDYIGFGASSQLVHPYYVIEPTTNAIVDLIHATKEFLADGVVSAQLSNHTYLMGYSQGGWSTMCAFKRLETGNDTISVDATSCGAGAYNLINAADYIASQETYPSPLYLPYYIYSHEQYGTITDPLNLFFNEPYATIIPGLFDGQHNHGQINSELNDTISALLNSDFITALTSPDYNAGIYMNFKNDLIENSVDAWTLKGNLHLYHGNADDNVPVSESRNIYQEFLKLNPANKVDYLEFDGLNHETGVVPWGVKTLLWFNSLENKN
jgi:pimeloyl-ACP methyl ester carboxylesterase